MKLLKSAVVALTLALSLGSFSTAALACEDGRTCFGPVQAIDMTLGHIAEAMKLINDGDDGQKAQKAIREASRAQKELNANDKVDRARQHANKNLKKARKAAKKGDVIEATKWLEKAEKAYSGLKSLL